MLLNQITQPVCAASSTSSSSSTSSTSFINQAPEAAYCPTISSQIVDPIIIKSNRVNATSISLTWGPYSGMDTFNVQYGFENGSWLYNTDVKGFTTTIGALPANRPIWVRVAARNDCQIGPFGQSRLIGGPSLPNTGYGPSLNLFQVFNQIKSWLLSIN